MTKSSSHIIDLRGPRRTPPPPPPPPTGGLARDLMRRPRQIAKQAIAERPRVVTPHRRLNAALEVVQYPLIAAAALGAAYSSTFGQILVLTYGLFALVTRRSSRLSFGIALFLLITIPFFQALDQTGIAENTAIYTYELLVIGTIQALVELRKTDKMPN